MILIAGEMMANELHDSEAFIPLHALLIGDFTALSDTGCQLSVYCICSSSDFSAVGRLMMNSGALNTCLME